MTTRRGTVGAVGVVLTLLLSGLSLAAIGAVGGWSPPFGVGRAGSSACTTPKLTGTIVKVRLDNTGGPMMAQRNGMMFGGAMTLGTDRSTVAQGEVTFVAANVGSVTHELVVLPLPGTQLAGTRQSSTDGKVDEAGSVGEASISCARGAGKGILPGTSSWVTLKLAPGRYEVVCNLAGHYAAGMYGQLTVTK
jgi:uncharacterized cupredoxin-like copper-binding protein